jgi:predicted porin
MQKKLIAAAVAGLLSVPAFAQSNVTISGLFKGGWEHYRLSGPGTGYESESRVSDQSSRIIFNVVEDLGGGLKAWGQVDSRFALDLGGGALGSGNTGVGLMGNWGKFTLGRWDVHYGEFGAIESNRAGSLQTYAAPGIVSQVTTRAAAAAAVTPQVSTMANGTRTPNILIWDSPAWNGFTARLAYSTSYAVTEGNTNRAVGNPGSGRAWTGALRYNNGPWTAGASYWNGNSESGVAGVAKADQRSTRAWGGYTFAMGLKLGLGYDRSSLDDSVNGSAGAVGAGTARRSAWIIPVSYSFGPHAIYGTYARAGSASGSAIASGTGSNYKAHQWTIGYDYAFSKRTSVGAFYTRLNNNSNAAGTVGASYNMFGLGASGGTAANVGEDQRQIYIGMAHSF